MKNLFILLCSLSLFGCKAVEETVKTGSTDASKAVSKTASMEKHEGYFNFYWDESAGKIWLEIDKWETEFLYVNSLAAGVGSNDIGLDRGQLGRDRVVKFVRSGDKALLVQPNYKYRAVSDNELEKRSVEEAFAQSILWGFKIDKSSKGDKVLVDATDFLLRDAHDVIGSLKGSKQGSYKLEKSRSAIYLPMCKSFPKNTELEATLTFIGKPEGRYIRSVTPSAEAVTVRQHHSFVELPDNNYKPRKLDPRCGYFGISYQDYATPIGAPLMKRYIMRHRLEKKNPEAEKSEAVEPIVYYLDPGTPEPVRSALIDGALWWNEAFEAAGFINAFQVKILPANADPMDVRYNLIQWVHRSTRGWSYGGSVSDPRTGEIIKGHVSLGSLRVRQDYLIAQGILAPFEEGKPVSDEMLEMALARLRQLSAHEVGHTIGIAHNFAASTNGRASVMDYPHPLIGLNVDGSFDFSNAYDDKIGKWDKRVVIYGYSDFPNDVNEEEALQQILKENNDLGLRFISDRDARPAGGAHPYAHLWDNGEDAVAELERMMKLRSAVLDNFSENNIPTNSPMSSLEEVLVPIYLSHRYQIDAVAKLIGGADYTYAMRGDKQTTIEILPAKTQEDALGTLLKTLEPDFLTLPENILQLLPPKTFAYDRGRESFKARTGLTFDPIAAAESSADMTMKLLLHRERAARMIEYTARNNANPGFDKLLNELEKTVFSGSYNGLKKEVNLMTQKLFVQHLIGLASNPKAAEQVRAMAQYKLFELEKLMSSKSRSGSVGEQAHVQYLLSKIEYYRNNPKEVIPSPAVSPPDGSPIGVEWSCSHDGH